MWEAVKALSGCPVVQHTSLLANYLTKQRRTTQPRRPVIRRDIKRWISSCLRGPESAAVLSATAAGLSSASAKKTSLEKGGWHWGGETNGGGGVCVCAKLQETWTPAWRRWEPTEPNSSYKCETWFLQNHGAKTPLHWTFGPTFIGVLACWMVRVKQINL